MSLDIVGYEHGRRAYFYRALIISFPAACSFVSRTYSHCCNLVLTPFVRDVFYVRLHLLGHFGRCASLAELEEHILHDWLRRARQQILIAGISAAEARASPRWWRSTSLRMQHHCLGELHVASGSCVGFVALPRGWHA